MKTIIMSLGLISLTSIVWSAYGSEMDSRAAYTKDLMAKAQAKQQINQKLSEIESECHCQSKEQCCNKYYTNKTCKDTIDLKKQTLSDLAVKAGAKRVNSVDEFCGAYKPQ